MSRHHLNIISTILLLLASFRSAVALPAFLGAEGAGANALGGRGGTVYHVTNLNDNGSSTLAGSLRQGLSAPNRTIVFDVSGTIVLTNDLSITSSNITIAGQTAPGDGIAIQGRTLGFNKTHDIVVRYLRCRPGDYNCPDFQGDSFDFGDNVTNVIVDHVSATWSVDECLSPTHAKNVTVQWCLIGESLKNSCHLKGAHGYGSLIRYGDGVLSLHHNLYVANDSRNPRPGDNVHLDFVNNVIYNWGSTCGYNGNDAPDNLANGGLYFTNFLNYVSNCLVAGPSSGTTIAFSPGVTNALQCQIYQSGNYIDNNKNSVLDGSNPGWGLFDSLYTQLAAPFTAPAIATDSPLTAYERVLAFCGDSRVRDSVDERIVRTARNHAGRLIDFISPTNFPGDYTTNSSSGYVGVNPWPTLGSLTAPVDSDGDGLPNYWEFNLGMNPQVTNNNHISTTGYTDLEDYLNFLGSLHGFAAVNATNLFDLRSLTGNDSNQLFSVASPTNGTVALDADGFTARFLPATNTLGFASFTFSATNALNRSAYGPVLVSVFVTNQAPQILVPPAPVVAGIGGTANFSVVAANVGLSYVWRKGGTNLVAGANIPGGVTNSTLTITNLSATDAASYAVVVSNFAGAVTSAIVSLQVITNGTPVPPANLTATASNSSIRLTWSPSVGATNYNLKRSLTNAASFVLLTSFAGTNYTDAQVTNGVTYYYAVSGVNAAGEGPDSFPVSYTLQGNQPPPAVQAILSNNPVAYWRLNETNGPTAYDSAVHFDGTSEGGVVFGGAGATNSPFPGFGTTNLAAQFNGVDADIALPALNLNTNTVTILGWVKLTGQQVHASGLLFCRNGTTNVSGLIISAASLTNQLGYNWNNNSSTYNWDSGLILPTNQWVFVAVAIAPSNAVVYMATNGILRAATNTVANAAQAFAGTAYLGYDPNQNIRRLNGSLDEVAVFRQTLSAAQISQILSNSLVSGLPPAPTNLLAAATNLQIRLSWNAVNGASQYNLKRGTAPGGPYPTVYSGLAGTNYSDSNVTNTITYYYVVSSVGVGGEGTNSLQVSAAPLPSGQRTNIVGTLAGSVFLLTWPFDHLGWRLQVQTNGLGTNWTDVPGSSATNLVSVGLAPAVSNAFYRIVYP